MGNPAVQLATNDETLEAEKIDKANNYTFAAYLGFSIPEILNFGCIFVMTFTKALLDFLLNTCLRFVLFPCAAFYGLIKAGLSWNSFRLTLKNKLSTLEDKTIGFLRALWETLNGLGTTGAVVTGIVGFFTGAAVGMGIAITFNFFLAASTAICAGYAGYYAYTARKAYKEWEETPPEDNTKHKKYLDYEKRWDMAIDNLTITGIVALLTIGVILAMVVCVPVVGSAIGVAGCLCCAAYSAYKLYNVIKAKESDAKISSVQLVEAAPDTTNATIHRSIGLPRTQSFNDLPARATTNETIGLRHIKSLNDLDKSTGPRRNKRSTDLTSIDRDLVTTAPRFRSKQGSN